MNTNDDNEPRLTRNGVTLTPEQAASIDRLIERGWRPQENTLTKLPGMTERAVSVLAVGALNRYAVIYFVIEPDGYAHT